MSREAMYEGISDVSTANAAATLADIEDNEPVGNTMTPAEINALIEAHVPLVKHIVFQVAVPTLHSYTWTRPTGVIRGSLEKTARSYPDAPTASTVPALLRDTEDP